LFHSGAYLEALQRAKEIANSGRQDRLTWKRQLHNRPAEPEIRNPMAERRNGNTAERSNDEMFLQLAKNFTSSSSKKIKETTPFGGRLWAPKGEGLFL
jgi:hypothetical protein